MFRISAKAIIILSGICFTGLVVLQIAWIRSAYQGELALRAKAKKQFESELQFDLGKNEELKKGLKDFLDHHIQSHSLKKEQEDWFNFSFIKAVELNPITARFNVNLDGISIVQHSHAGSPPARTKLLVSTLAGLPDTTRIRKAGKLCVHCILGLSEGLHDQYNYQILLFYKDRLPAFFGRLWVLILGSFFLLIVLVFLFRGILKMYSQEKRLSEAKNDFINNLTHEMQTPVFAIQMANRLIKDKTGSQPEISTLTKIIEKEAGQLKQHAGRILDLASLEEGQIELGKETIDLNKLIKEKLPTVELMVQARKGELITELDTGPLFCELDPVHFNNVLVSLADNAIKYNERAPRIIITTGEMDRKVFVKLTDNGIGISREYLPYVTDKFFRVPHVKRNGIAGFGLGLSYVKQIIELHGGELQLSGEEGAGMTVLILLPQSMSHA